MRSYWSALGILLSSTFLLVTTAATAPSTFFSTGNPDGRMGTASRPASGGNLETETADDFVSTQGMRITQATFTGLLPLGAPLSSITRVEIEMYRVFPQDSTNPPSGHVPTRVNSPADVEIAFATRDSQGGSLSFTPSVLSASFGVSNSVVNGINPLPPQLTGGEGPVTGEEVLITVTFNPPINLPAGHYFFRPEVQLSAGNFLWLSAPKPIVAPGTPFAADLQSWIRNDNLRPDWLRIGTDITGQGPFNATFSLIGEPIQLSDLVPGSLLVFPIFDIATNEKVTTGTNGSESATRLRITNQLPANVAIAIHTICPPSSINGNVCEDLDSLEVLTGHETREFAVTNGQDLGSDSLYVGCQQGFIVVFASALDATGKNPADTTSPISWNQLTGSYQVVNAADQKYQGSAIAFQSPQLLGTALGTANSDPSLLDLKFDATDYNPLPAQLFGDFQAIGEANDTQLILLYLNFVTGTSSTGNVSIDFWNEDEKRFSHSNHSLQCWQKVSLNGLDNDFRFREGPLGSPLGSLRISPRANLGVLGAVIETEGSPSIRQLFHTGSQPATFTIESGQ